MSTKQTYQIEAFYDGGCPLCSREITWLRRWDRKQQILFTDIDAADFRCAPLGKSQEELVAQMHARLPDGTWITGVEVFRQLYSLVGLGVPVWMSRWPIISPLLELLYAVFARIRLRLPRRCSRELCEIQDKT